MSIQNEIDRISANITSAYNAVEEKGGVLPKKQNSDNLAAAIQEIPTSEGGVYSLEERRIGTWTDGKPLYRKTFQFTTPKTNTSTSVTGKLSYPNVKRLYGYVGINNNSLISTVPLYFDPNTYVFAAYATSTDTIQMIAAGDMLHNVQAAVTIEYTK